MNPVTPHLRAMNKPVLWFAAVCFCVAARGADAPAVYSLSAANLAASHTRLAAGAPLLQPALARLRQDADAALAFSPVSVTQKKRVPPPGGDRHNYYSQAPYWWPDPAKPDGLPYVNRDGHTFPGSKQDTDSENLWILSQRAETLALAYYFTDRHEYAAHAAMLVRVFFLNPATRMNPNLRFAQLIPGHDDVRGTGVLDGRCLPDICDAVGLLRHSAAWTKQDDVAFDAWLSDYFTWLTTSAKGRAEHAAANNHGVWYLAQAAGIAARLGRNEEARRYCQEAVECIDREITPEGKLPLELARTRSLHYSMFTLEAFTQLATIGESVGVDLWGHVGPAGQSLRAALTFLAPFADPAKPWIKSDVHPDPRSRLLPLLALARSHWPDRAFADALRDFGSHDGDLESRWHLLAGEPALHQP